MGAGLCILRKGWRLDGTTLIIVYCMPTTVSTTTTNSATMGLQHTAYLCMFIAIALRLVEAGTTRVRCT